MAEKQRILIVDDDYNIAELISLYLTKECFETKIVGDGEEALRVFPEFQPNLILLDLMLPGIDGYQVCRELRSTSQVPIIMLSAKGEIFDKVLELEGVVFTMYDARTNLSLQVVENVKQNLNERIYKTIIPRNVRLAEAPSHGMPINLYDSRSTGAESYRLLAAEVISRGEEL